MCTFSGILNIFIVSAFLKPGEIPSELITWAKYSTLVLRNEHFAKFSFNPAESNKPNALSNEAMPSLTGKEEITVSIRTLIPVRNVNRQVRG
ncbi:hypothetical protein Trydic_g16916 [Trypoxylus dichotomus]